MGLRTRIRQYSMQRVIQTALAKRTGRFIPTSGDQDQNNNFYVIYLLDKEKTARFLVENLAGDEVQGKWSLDGNNFAEEKALNIAELADFQPWIHHFYRGGIFYTIGITMFFRYRWSCWPWIRVKFDRYLQSRFNKRELPRQDQMNVLRYILSETVKNHAFQTDPTSLLTHFYSARWVHRPDKEELMTYYTLLLDSMKEAQDLEDTEHHGYKLKPQALNTITTFDLEDQRHDDNKKNQKGIFWLTMVLMVVGILQAGAAAYETWWKSPQIFTGTIGGQAIDLIQK